MTSHSDHVSEPQTIHPGSRIEAFARSPQFRRLFDDGMSLIEESAEYLSLEGRTLSEQLEHIQSLAFSSESAKLTTRLMQAAAWLLVMRAIREAELPGATLLDKKHRLSVAPFLQQKLPDFGDGPAVENFQSLVARARSLLDQISRCDLALSTTPPTASPVARQIDQINSRLGLSQIIEFD